jgi:hypothetical protein
LCRPQLCQEEGEAECAIVTTTQRGTEARLPTWRALVAKVEQLVVQRKTVRRACRATKKAGLRLDDAKPRAKTLEKAVDLLLVFTQQVLRLFFELGTNLLLLVFERALFRPLPSRTLRTMHSFRTRTESAHCEGAEALVR